MKRINESELENCNLRYAEIKDLKSIIEIASESFNWNKRKMSFLKKKWINIIQKKNIIVSYDSKKKVNAFSEVHYRSDKSNFISDKKIFNSIYENLARILLCNKRFSKEGPFLFITAVKKNENIGIGMKIFNIFKKNYDVVSIMFEKNNHKLEKYYKVLGFYQEENPLPFPFDLIVEMKYIYAVYRKKNKEKTG